MNYSGINYESIVDGEGVRVTIFFSGCNHHCEGCHNPKSWNFQNGRLFDDSTLKRIKTQLNKPYMSGITISGGDLLCNEESKVLEIIQKLRQLLNPNQTIWVYTGFTFEEIKKMKYLKLIDVLVDGKFMLKLYDPQLLWVGSSNQRIIDVKKTLKKKKIILYNKED